MNGTGKFPREEDQTPINWTVMERLAALESNQKRIDREVESLRMSRTEMGRALSDEASARATQDALQQAEIAGIRAEIKGLRKTIEDLMLLVRNSKYTPVAGTSGVVFLYEVFRSLVN